jgi:hypothetical protein
MYPLIKSIVLMKHWFCSTIMFVPQTKTLPHPLIVGAGFDGTGLSALQRALAILGKTRTTFPAFAQRDCNKYEDRGILHPCSDIALIDSVMQHGFQNDSYPASMWANTDAVMGHPVPLFVWDFLEAFPNAKVILTVRQADALWDTISRISVVYAAKLADVSAKHLTHRLVWGMERSWRMYKRHFLRHYWQHNAKVIHGVPRAQLLVWDIHDEPSWKPLCDFLGVPTSSTPFPVPTSNEF